MRNRLPDFLTLPSSTLLTCRARPISSTLTFLPLNENEDVRAATFKFSIFARAFSSSSANPSQKYSFSESALMLTNGRTAIEGWLSSCCVGSSALRGGTESLRVEEDSELGESLTKRLPSARQNASLSSFSTRLHWGQRFIIKIKSPFRAGLTLRL